MEGSAHVCLVYGCVGCFVLYCTVCSACVCCTNAKPILAIVPKIRKAGRSGLYKLGRQLCLLTSTPNIWRKLKVQTLTALYNVLHVWILYAYPLCTSWSWSCTAPSCCSFTSFEWSGPEIWRGAVTAAAQKWLASVLCP